METIKNCPLCNSNSTIKLYSNEVRFQSDTNDPNVAFRNFFLDHVLQTHSLISEFRLCFNCSFMFFNPRLSQSEVDRLYNPNYLLNIRKYSPTFGEDPDVLLDPPMHRAIMIKEIVSNYGYTDVKNILDYGGSNGFSMRAFTDSIDKFVLDPSVTTPLPNVKMISVIHEKAPYDLIICTHVLEHLVQLREIWDGLITNLREGGLLYIEVPYDFPTTIRLQLGLGDFEHINFFNKTALLNIAHAYNLTRLYSGIRTYLYGTSKSNQWETIVNCALFQKNSLNSTNISHQYFPSLIFESAEFILLNKVLNRKNY